LGLTQRLVSVTITSQAAFEQELEIFRKEEEAAQQQFFAYLSVRELAASDTEVLRAMNTTPLFWLTTHHAMLVSAFIALGRIFDQNSAHNIDSLMALASKDLSVFSKPALAKRKEKAGLKTDEATAYVSDAFEPTASDLRALRKEIKAQRVIYEARYRDIRDKVFAHNEVFDLDVANQLLANTSVAEMKAAFGFLHSLYETLWQLFHNGRKLGLNARAFVLPPGSNAGAQILPGEKVFREGQRVLAHVVRGIEAEAKGS
jgi:hypothetical protein